MDLFPALCNKRMRPSVLEYLDNCTKSCMTAMSDFGNNCRMVEKKDTKQKRKAVQNGSCKPPGGPSNDVKSLRVELGVHQEELKSQNEELRQAQFELSRAHDRYKGLFESAPIGYLVIDGSFMIHETNLKASSLLGVPGKGLIGTPLSKFMERNEADAYYLQLLEVLKRGAQQSCEMAFRRPDGTVFHGYLEASPHEDSLFGSGWRIALVDITERKRAEDALRESEDALRQANDCLERRVGERTADLQTLTGELERSRQELRRLAAELVQAEERERKRIAGVLHDDIAQVLAAVRMRLDLLHDRRTSSPWRRPRRSSCSPSRRHANC